MCGQEVSGMTRLEKFSASQTMGIALTCLFALLVQYLVTVVGNPQSGGSRVGTTCVRGRTIRVRDGTDAINFTMDGLTAILVNNVAGIPSLRNDEG